MRNRWIMTLGLLATMAACSGVTPAAPASVPALDGTSWTVTHLNGQPTIEGRRPTMKFTDGRVGGTTGCNSYSAGYTRSATSITVGDQITMTAMLCVDEAVMAQETTVARSLPTVASARTAGSGLELLDATRKVVFTLAPVETKLLEGTTWQLSGVIANEAVSSPVADSVVTMTISGGRLHGKACNTFRGSVTAVDGMFSAGPLMSTKMACPSQELTTQETTVLANLQSATTYAIDESTLTLSGPGGTGLMFTAA